MNENILKIIADNPALLEILSKILLDEFETPFNEGFSNERLGEIFRARIIGKEAIGRAFSKILENRTSEIVKPKENPAR